MGRRTLIWIAHRGNIDGPKPDQENRPAYIRETLEQGYDCEIDLWKLNNGLYLGHDEPQFRIEEFFLTDPRLWIHAKNREALRFLIGSPYNYFWHENDRYTMTSKGYTWCHKSANDLENSILCLPTIEQLSNLCKEEMFMIQGICTDNITGAKQFL